MPAALHPANAGWQQRLGFAVLQESPECAAVRLDGPLHERLSQADGEGEVGLGTRPRPGIEEGVPDARGSAASAVVVPEAWSQPFGQAGGPHAVAATRIPAGGGLSRDLGDAGPVEGKEEQRRARRAVTPAVGDGVGLRRVRRRDGERDCQPITGRVPERDEMLGTPPSSLDEVPAVQLGAGQREARGDAG